MTKKLYEKYKNMIYQFFKFGIVGVINTINNYLVYRFCLYIKINYVISTTIAFIVSSIIGYILQKKFVFDSKVKKKTSLVKFYIVYISSYFISLGLTILFVEYFKISDKYAPLLVLFVTVPYNFILSRFWVYKEKRPKGEK